ncbi:hypothetical protein HK100_012021 [Physocladia obscura]|uniref:Uncharacterized protein n=1 Tax=Physocladia obscura TaxID=109957 RepID=A0AAD5T2Z0_9FUNG|nr:hypothetical protein HK100_012021 [Physocladia obscura]
MSAETTAKLAPQKTQRARCWAARDAYFECLDLHKLWLHGLQLNSHDQIVAIDVARAASLVRPAAESESSDSALSRADRARLFACREPLLRFESECLPSWVFHFSMLRVKELQTKHLIDYQEVKENELRNKPDSFWDKVKERTK